VLHGLERKEFVRRERRSSVESETEYAFRHILVRDVAYGQIPRAERSDRHARAAAWIESLGRPADHAELLAQHYLAAGDLEPAAEAAVLQAELTWFAGEGERTAEHLRRAAEFVDRLPPSFSTAYVLSDLARYHMLASRSAEAIEVGHRALAIADDLGLQ